MPLPEFETCHVCHGTGKHESKKCEECNGEGRYSYYKYNDGHDIAMSIEPFEPIVPMQEM